MVKYVNESESISEAVNRLIGLNRYVNENEAIPESTLISRELVRAVAEALSISDGLAKLLMEGLVTKGRTVRTGDKSHTVRTTDKSKTVRST